MSTTSDTLKHYTSEYRRHPWYLLSSLSLGPGFVLQNILSALFVAKLFGELAAHQPVDHSYVWLAIVCLLTGTIITFLGDRFGNLPLSSFVIHQLYAKCLNKLLEQEYGFFANSFAGSLVTAANRFSKGYELFSNVIFLEMVGIWSGVITAIGIMLYYNPTLGGIIAILWVISIVVVLVLVQRRIPIRRHAVAKESELTGDLADALTNAMTIKTFAREKPEEIRYELSNRERTRRFSYSWSLAVRNHFALQLLCAAMQLVLIFGGIRDIENGSLTVAEFLLFQVYILQIINSIMKASIEMRQLEGIFGDAGEMTELLNRSPVIEDPAHPEPSRIMNGTIDFKAVTFAYQDEGSASPELFSDFTLHIEQGEKVGLVGPSGGGKTTITKLLLRFMDVQSGTIEIDNQDIRRISQDDLHRSISYVPQDPLLFHRSIEENIRYGNEDADDEQVKRAAKRSHADEFIRDLTEGYDTLVGERGIKLSGGQRQRVAIARAMLKPAPVLVLDEATSALDSESEAFIQDSLWELMKHKTTLVIAHRLSTIQRMDRIVVLDNGKIVESGSHHELLKQKGLYAKLWKHQSGGFLES